MLEQNLRILIKQERTKNWVRLLPWAVLTMNSQQSFPTGYTPQELFHQGRCAWFFKTPFPEDYKMLIVAFGLRLLLYSPKYVSEINQEL